MPLPTQLYLHTSSAQILLLTVEPWAEGSRLQHLGPGVDRRQRPGSWLDWSNTLKVHHAVKKKKKKDPL